VINSLTSGGGTAGSAGIDLAYDQARSAYVEGGVNNVILCTDGDFNIGPSSNDELLAQIEEERRTGVTLTALGFGTRNNDFMMEAVSNAGNGTYAVIYDQGQASDFAEHRMLSAFQYIAKDVKLQVEFNEEHVLAYRLLGYENRAIADEDFRDDKVDAGEIGAGHSVTALYELVLAGGSVPGSVPEAMDGDAYDGEVEVAENELVRVKVRYKDVDANALDEAYEVFLGLTPDEVAESHRSLSPNFQWAVAVATFAEVLRGSPYVDSAALPLIEQVVEDYAAGDSAKEEFATLFARASALLGGETPAPTGEDQLVTR
jgi:Ca-activated chloride channel family protein